MDLKSLVGMSLPQNIRLTQATTNSIIGIVFLVVVVIVLLAWIHKRSKK